MRILEKSYANIVAQLTSETLKQLVDVDFGAADIEPIMGIAQVHVGGGVYLTMQLNVSVTTPQMLVKCAPTLTKDNS